MRHRLHLASLQDSGERITFVDTLLLVRLYRQGARMDEPFLSSLAAWGKDGPLTLGAKDVIDSLLKAEGRKVRQERARSMRPLGLSDHGRTIRTTVGSTIIVELERRDRLGFDWEAVPPNPIGALRIETSPERPGVVRVCFEPEAAGTCELTLRETANQQWVRPSGPAQEHHARELRLTLLVAAGSP